MDFLLWQLADSGFPAGGFAHSGGLEAALHHGEVADADALWSLVLAAIAQAGHGALPLVTAAYSDMGDLAELDALCDAFLSNPVPNRASRAQGQAFLSTCARAFPESSAGALQAAVRREGLCGHHAPVFGATLMLLGVERSAAQRLCLYLTGRGAISAGIRLGVIGAYDAQRLLSAIGPEIDRTIERCAHLGPLDITQTAPRLDLLQSTHDRLYSRLFQS